MALNAKLWREMSKSIDKRVCGIGTFNPSRMHASTIDFVFFFSTYVSPLNGVSAEARYNRRCAVGSVTKLLRSTGFSECNLAKSGVTDDESVGFCDGAIVLD